MAVERLKRWLNVPPIKEVEGPEKFENMNVLEELLTVMETVMVLSRKSPNSISIKSIGVALSFILSISGSLWHVVNNYDKNMPVSMYVENVYGTTPAVVITIVFVVYASKPRIILDTIESLREFKFGRPPFAAYKDRLINLYLAFTFFVTCATGMVYMLQGIIQQPYCERVKEKLDLKIVCGFGTYVWIPWSLDSFIVRNITRVLHSWAVWNIFAAGATFCHTTFVFVEHVIIRIDHLKDLLKDVFVSDDYLVHKKNLLFCIKYHIEIIRLVDIVMESVKYVLFIHLSVSSLVISVCLYNFTLEIKFKPTYFLITYLMSTFLVCFAGQRLLDKSNELSYQIYCMNWYETSANVQKYVLFMLMRSQRHLQLKAIVTTLSYSTFMSILSSAYSYWTVMMKR